MANILIVDDDVNIRETLQEILEEAGYSVMSVGTGRDGVAFCRHNDVDVLLLDLRLPDMDGIEVLREVIGTSPGLPVIVISAFGTIDRAVEAVKMGAYDFIEKPLQEEKLLVVVRNALNQKMLEQELKEVRNGEYEQYGMIGVSPQMLKVFHFIEQASATDLPVLITGESGVGKELVARAIHKLSGRKGLFVAINCTSVPEHLFESELFGVEKGAYTGAVRSKKGKLEIADRGTVLFDEIGDMPLFLQPKLLRWMEDGMLCRVGGVEQIRTDVRIICATKWDLVELVKKKRFRDDLYYRVRRLHIHIPPLRERREDIHALMEHYKGILDKKYGVHNLSPSAKNYLCSYNYPGNVRELKSLLENLWVMLKDREIIDLPDVLNVLGNKCSDDTHCKKPLKEARKEFERSYILSVLEETHWNIRETAKILGIERTNLYRKLRSLRIPYQK